MIVKLISEPAGPNASRVAELAKALEASRIKFSLVDADSRDGIALAEIYGINRRPAVLVTQDDGVMAHLWQGNLPNADELGYSTRS